MGDGRCSLGAAARGSGFGVPGSGGRRGGRGWGLGSLFGKGRGGASGGGWGYVVSGWGEGGFDVVSG